MKIKTKIRGKRVVPVFGERNLAKGKIKKKKQNSKGEPSLNQRERENLQNF